MLDMIHTVSSGADLQAVINSGEPAVAECVNLDYGGVVEIPQRDQPLQVRFNRGYVRGVVVEGHPQGLVGKNEVWLHGARVGNAGVDMVNANFVTVERFDIEGADVAIWQVNHGPGSWSEHNTYRDIRIVNCSTGWLFDRGAGNRSMRGTLIEGQTTMYGCRRPFHAEHVDLYSSQIRVSMWAKPSTGRASMCLDDVGIRGSYLELQHENPADLGIWLDSPDAHAAQLRAHFSHDCGEYAMRTERTAEPITRVTYDVGVTRQPSDPWWTP